jgi:hypothetical protein
MKKVSNGMVFDTETATLLVNCKTPYGDSSLYRTEKGNFFATYLNEDGETLSHIESDCVDQTIEEWEDLDGEVTIMFDKFLIG